MRTDAEIAAYKRQYYIDNKPAINKRNKEWNDKNRDRISEYNKDYYAECKAKYAAKGKINYALRKGTIAKTDCTECGATEDIQGHHKDYDKPLEVVWLCRSCHQQLHSREKGEIIDGNKLARSK